MASYRICESELMGDEFVMFCGNYSCATPSVVSAIQNTDIIIEGIAGVTGNQFSMRTYPRGRFCCAECEEWKELDKYNHAWAVRCGQTCELVYPGLVCEDCTADDADQGYRFAIFAHHDYYETVRNKAKDAMIKRMVKKWRLVVHDRKEHRQMVKMASLVFQRNLTNTPVDWRSVMAAFVAHT